MGEIDRLTGEIATVARATLRDVATVERNARRAPSHRPSGRLAQVVAELAETAAGTRRLLEQTALRLAGIRTIPDRLVSLADPDARPIRKGKPQHPISRRYWGARWRCPRRAAFGCRGSIRPTTRRAHRSSSSSPRRSSPRQSWRRSWGTRWASFCLPPSPTPR